MPFIPYVVQATAARTKPQSRQAAVQQQAGLPRLALQRGCVQGQRFAKAPVTQGCARARATLWHLNQDRTLWATDDESTAGPAKRRTCIALVFQTHNAAVHYSVLACANHDWRCMLAL